MDENPSTLLVTSRVLQPAASPAEAAVPEAKPFGPSS